MADEDILTNMTAATNDENLEIQDTFTSVGLSMKRSWKKLDKSRNVNLNLIMKFAEFVIQLDLFL